MPMSPTTVQPLIEAFMVPVGPKGTEDPPRGWPDGAQQPPPPIETTSTSGSEFDVTVAAALTPGALVGGFVSLPPYWPGAKIVANTGTGVTVDTAAKNPAGNQTVDVDILSSSPTLIFIGAAASAIVRITRLGDGFLVVVDPTVPGHNLATGAIGIASGVVTPTLEPDDIVRVEYEPPFGGTIPAGLPITLTKPKPEVSGLSTGTAWAGVYRALFAAGGANGVPPLASLLDPAEAAMKTVIDGMMSVPGLAPAALQAGALAFWGVVAGSAAALWPGALSATPPPALATLALLLAPGSPASLALMACVPSDPWTPVASQAAAAIFAGVLYTASLGGLVVFSGPAAFPFL